MGRKGIDAKRNSHIHVARDGSLSVSLTQVVRSHRGASDLKGVGKIRERLRNKREAEQS